MTAFQIAAYVWVAFAVIVLGHKCIIQIIYYDPNNPGEPTQVNKKTIWYLRLSLGIIIFLFAVKEIFEKKLG